jgi:hypothetical protein
MPATTTRDITKSKTGEATQDLSPIPVNQPVEQSTLMLFEGNPVKALQAAESMVQYMAAKCSHLVMDLRGKKYPLVEWWTTVGSGLGLFPVEVSSTRLNRDGEIVYEAVVEVRRHGMVVTRASAIASSKERSSWASQEYSIKSMATTRATGKAYRLPLGWLARLAGLEPTPADEMPQDDGSVVSNHVPAAAKPAAKAAPAAAPKRDDLDDEGEAEFTCAEATIAKEGEGKFGPWRLIVLKTAEGPQFGSLNKRIGQEMLDAAEAGARCTIRWKRTPKGGLDCVALDVL